jgi:hypothetical protein
MKVSEAPLGTVFRMAGFPGTWLKATDVHVRLLGVPGWQTKPLWMVGQKFAQNVEPPPPRSAICRLGDVLFLSEGDVRLEYLYPWAVIDVTAEQGHTRFVLRGSSFAKSLADEVTAEAALPFTITRGSQHLGRPSNSMIFAYKGRVYARATVKEMTGKSKVGGYKLTVTQGGEKRLLIAGLLTLPEEGALHDVIQDHFGPGAGYR